MQKVFVTGANSFLATNIIIELLNKGYSVIGLLRDINRFHYTKHPNLTLVEGDIASPGTFEGYLMGCGAVIHVAAITAQDLPRYSYYKKINVDATKGLIELAHKHGIRKFVYVSTANTLGYGTKNNPGNEKTPMKYPFTKSNYALSKLAGQEIVLSYSNKLDVVVVNPTFMLGQYDSKPSSGKIILMGYKKKILFYPPGGKNFVHVEDAAKGVVSVLEKGKNAEIYLLAGDNLSYKEFFVKLSEETGQKTMYVKIPGFLLLLLGLAGSLMRFFKIKTNLSISNMKALCINNYFENKKAKEQLGIRFKPVETSINDAMGWFKGKNMIK